MSYPASKLRNIWEEVKKRSDDNVQAIETHKKFGKTWKNSLNLAETDRNLQIFTNTHNNSKLNMNIS